MIHQSHTIHSAHHNTYAPHQRVSEVLIQELGTKTKYMYTHLILLWLSTNANVIDYHYDIIKISSPPCILPAYPSPYSLNVWQLSFTASTILLFP